MKSVMSGEKLSEESKAKLISWMGNNDAFIEMIVAGVAKEKGGEWVAGLSAEGKKEYVRIQLKHANSDQILSQESPPPT